MSTYLRCKIRPGQFTGEVAIKGTTCDGKWFSLFVSEKDVDAEGPLVDSGDVDGWMRVDVLQSKSGLLLVRLPGQTFENGRTITVKEEHVQERQPREKV